MVTEFAVAVVVAELVVGAETFDFTTEAESRGEIDGTVEAGLLGCFNDSQSSYLSSGTL